MELQEQKRNWQERKQQTKRRSFPPLRNCLNYAYVVQQLLNILNEPFQYHINLLNAVLNCQYYDSESGRFIQLTGTPYSIYLSNMLRDKRNPPSTLANYMTDGIPTENGLIIPTAATFESIAKPKWSVKMGGENEFRGKIRYCLLNGDVSHLTEEMQAELFALTNNKESNFFELVFTSMKYVIIAKNNDAYRDISSAELLEQVEYAINDVALMSTGFITLYEEDSEKI